MHRSTEEMNGEVRQALRSTGEYRPLWAGEMRVGGECGLCDVVAPMASQGSDAPTERQKKAWRKLL